MRGKPAAVLWVHGLSGITPAGAGKTTAIIPPITATRGSPPQVRGKRLSDRHLFRLQRITPAGAGKTFCSGAGNTCAGDHPRRCGENSGKFLRPSAPTGSPPRMRGKPYCPRGGRHDNRITPADAGKTKGYTWKEVNDGDHPRGCGENVSAILSKSITEGSPPRMRGKPAGARLFKSQPRITPADAGKTCRRTGIKQ